MTMTSSLGAIIALIFFLFLGLTLFLAYKVYVKGEKNLAAAEL